MSHTNSLQNIHRVTASCKIYVLTFPSLLVSYLTTLSVSRLYNVDNRITNEYGALGGIRIDRETDVLRANLLQCHFVHHKSNMARSGPPPPWLFLLVLPLSHFPYKMFLMSLLTLFLYLQLVPRSRKNVDLYIHSPIRLHGVVLN
jgi:hypothetical protein